ncbi:DUF397 domain-containing protein [Streptoalloteichus hindustanus]|uniref:DUF397 domain-containing protein n=1 Tax=Streptoalloteichus hindustanus TaxID=2017 RepID=A0A1M4YN34_STRHI|nr:DUF397 domain-containing protein [Streptoalloteichus hindustanus]SHF06912.1 protein of unknown function [Streptoalloteichus hindustanus]
MSNDLHMWRKSSRSGQENACVEVAMTESTVAVRDSKNAAGPALAFTPAAFSTFVATVKAGQLDLS